MYIALKFLHTQLLWLTKAWPVNCPDPARTSTLSALLEQPTTVISKPVWLWRKLCAQYTREENSSLPNYQGFKFTVKMARKIFLSHSTRSSSEAYQLILHLTICVTFPSPYALYFPIFNCKIQNISPRCILMTFPYFYCIMLHKWHHQNWTKIKSEYTWLCHHLNLQWFNRSKL